MPDEPQVVTSDAPTTPSADAGASKDGGKGDGPGSLSKREPDLIQHVRMVQSSSDRQFALLTKRLDALAEQLGAATHNLIDATGADDEVKEAVKQRVAQASQAARSQPAEFAERMEYIEEELEDHDLTIADLGGKSVLDYANGSRKDFIKDMREAARRKKAAPVATVSAAEKKIADLEAQIKALKGEDVVPVGSAGTPAKAHKTADDWTPSEYAEMKKMLGRR